jgi:hypothetical protein
MIHWWKYKKLKIDMHFDNRDDKRAWSLQGGIGSVFSIVKDKTEKYNYIEVIIKWNDDYIQQDDINLTIFFENEIV